MTRDQAVPGGPRPTVASVYDNKELTRTYSKVFWRIVPFLMQCDVVATWLVPAKLVNR